jgi:hypothetical protein
MTKVVPIMSRILRLAREIEFPNNISPANQFPNARQLSKQMLAS